jgi:tetratricopeptide (TPR) repeat protein
MTTNTFASAGSSHAVLGRVRRPPGQLWQVPTFLAGLVAVVLVAAASPFASQPPDDSLDSDLTTVRAALAKGGGRVDHVVALAENAVAHAGHQGERVGEAHFLLGAVYMRLAERSPSERAPEERDKAAMHLELAELRGVPAADQARLQYWRGKLLFLSGRDPQRAIELLSGSLPGGADNVAEAYGILVQAHLHKAPPDLDAALAANLKQMEVCEDEALLTQARMLRGELFLKKEMRVEAIKAFEAIGPKAAPAVRHKARFLQATAAMEEGLWGRAVPWWQELLAQPDVVPGGKARILYNLGLCCLNFEPPAHESQAVAAWQETELYGGEEAQAAALRLAELRLGSGNNQAAALEHLRKALEKVCTAHDYKNKLIDVRKARELLEEACRYFNDQEDHERFLQAAELYKKLAAPGAAEEKIGHAAEARGRELLARAKEQNADADILQEQARTVLQQAALAYEQAAESRPPAQRSDVLWHCIECYQLANEPVQAITVLKKFVELPVSSERKAEAWFTLAEMQRLLHHPDARESYKQCVGYNNDAFTARALLHLADMAIEQKQLKDAEAVLLQVAQPGSPIADRAAHELALLKLANFYFQQRQFDKAALQCKELIKQYPAHPSLWSMREQLAECYRNLAVQALARVEGPEVVTAAEKQHYRRVWQEHLEAARDVYQQLADDLDAKASVKALSAAEDALRHKATFVVADCYFDLPNWFEEALKRYQKLFELHRKEGDGLWACQRLYRCWGWAHNSKYHDEEVVRFAAESAVEFCLRNLDQYERARAFHDAEEKTRWLDWLQRVRDDLARSSKRGSG